MSPVALGNLRRKRDDGDRRCPAVCPQPIGEPPIQKRCQLWAGHEHEKHTWVESDAVVDSTRRLILTWDEAGVVSTWTARRVES